MRAHRLFVQTSIVLAGAALAVGAAAAPTLRKTVDQKGDFVLIGNTLGHDCRAGVPAPIVGTIGQCGANTADSSLDVVWRSDQPSAGLALADASTATSAARSTAVLANGTQSNVQIPAGATITYARVYWAGTIAGNNPVNTAKLDRPNGFSVTLTADDTKTVTGGFGLGSWYQATADVTTLVQSNGVGAYRLGAIDLGPVAGVNNSTLIGGWYMVVFYRLPTDPLRNLTLFDGLDGVNGTAANATLKGFLVPNSGFSGKLGVAAFEGDFDITGDQLLFNGVALANALNPADNFFNSTRSALGLAVSPLGDLPQLAGTAGSQSGLDLDVIDVTPRLSPGDTQATVSATTNGDVYGLGAFVTSMTTLKPDFSSTTKTVTNVTRSDGSFLAGDVLEYTITTKNEGTDASADTALTDKLPNGVTYQPGTLVVSAGANAGPKTDGAGDDQAEYDGGTKTVTFRIGAGATATTGGSLAINATTTVTFRVKIDPNTNGTIANQAVVTSKGAVGKTQNVPALDTVSTGNGGFGSPTNSLLDECSTNQQCAGGSPICDNGGPHPWKCRPCSPANGEADCKPVSGVCVTSSNDPKVGQCVDCNSTSDCKSPATCDVTAHVCVDCKTNTDCKNPNPVCSPLGRCGPCKTNFDCAGNPAGTTCETSGPLAGTCQECTTADTTACSGTRPRCDTASDRCVAAVPSGPDGGGADAGPNFDDAETLQGGGIGCNGGGDAPGSAWPLGGVAAAIAARLRRRRR